MKVDNTSNIYHIFLQCRLKKIISKNPGFRPGFENVWPVRERFIPKITQYVNLIMVVIFIYKLRGTYLISSEPTLFQPP